MRENSKRILVIFLTLCMISMTCFGQTLTIEQSLNINQSNVLLTDHHVEATTDDVLSVKDAEQYTDTTTSPELDAEITQGYVTVSIEKTTLNQGFILQPVKVPYKSGMTAKDALELAISGTDVQIQGLDKGYIEAVSDEEEPIEPTEIIKIITEQNCFDADERKSSSWLTQGDYNIWSGWMYLLNEKFSDQYINDQLIAPNDVIRLSFSIYMGDDLGHKGFSGAAFFVENDKSVLLRLLAEHAADASSAQPIIKERYEKALKVAGDLQATEEEIEMAKELLIENLQVVPADSIQFNIQQNMIKVGETLQCQAKVLPENATDQQLIWEVVPETGDATISAEGLLSATKAGKIKVLVYTKELGRKKAAVHELKIQGENVFDLHNSLVTAKAFLQAKTSYDGSTYTIKNTPDWNVLVLARSGETIPDDYFKGIENVIKGYENEDALKKDIPYVTQYARMALAITASGHDPRNVGGFDFIKAIYSQEAVLTAGINATIYSLLALDAHAYEVPAEAAVTRQALYQSIVSQHNQGEGWGFFANSNDVDVTAMALQALAPYYSESEAVRKVVDEAVNYLSKIQTDNGGFNGWNGKVSAESTAQVVVALTALKIDPQQDSRFIKNGHTLLDAFQPFYCEADGGFKQQPSDQFSNLLTTQQTGYALVACQRFEEGKTSLYDMSDVTFSSQHPGSGEVNPPSGGGSSESDITKTYEVTMKVADPKGKTYLTRQSFKVKANESALDLLKASGLEVLIVSSQYGDYVQGIEGLKEMDEGPQSGWMYRVNGKFLEVGAGQYKLQPGDFVEWLYTRDYGQDINGYEESVMGSSNTTGGSSTESSKVIAIEKDQIKEGTAKVQLTLSQFKAALQTEKDQVPVLTLKNTGAMDTIALTFKQEAADYLKEQSQGMKLATSLGTITLTSDFIKEMAKELLGEKELVLTMSQKEIPDFENPGNGKGIPICVNLEWEGKKQEESFNQPVKVTMPYLLAEDGKELVLYKAEKNQWVQQGESLQYDETAQAVTVSLEVNTAYYLGHTSKAASTEKNQELSSKTFTDVKGWAAPFIAEVSQKGIMQGKKAQQFGGKDAITQAEMMVVLSRLSGEDLKDYTTTTFTGVSEEKWYYTAVCWAEAKEMVENKSKKFNPDHVMTKSELAVLLKAYFDQSQVKLETSEGKEAVFKDTNQIAPDAREAVNYLYGIGLLAGNEQGNFMPDQKVTREEVAKIIALYMRQQNTK